MPINRLKAFIGTANDVWMNFILIFGKDRCNFRPPHGNPQISVQLKQMSGFLDALPLFFREIETALLASANPPPPTGNASTN